MITPQEERFQRMLELSLQPFYEGLYGLLLDDAEAFLAMSDDDIRDKIDNDPRVELLLAALIVMFRQGLKVGASVAAELLNMESADVPMSETYDADQHALELVSMTATSSLVVTIANDLISLRNAFKSDVQGLMATAKAWIRTNVINKARIVAATETNRIVNRAAMAIYRTVGVKRVEFRIREGACPKCAPLQGIYNIDEVPQLPPIHPYCYCLIFPYFGE